MAGVFEHHDRNRFETIAISLQPEFPSPTRNRLQIAFDDFIGAARMSDRQVAELIRAREIDIAVDLTGYTGHTRADIFADRPSPIQVNYLAFPGTMGAEFIDYIVADKVVIPEDQHDAYTERVVYLPETYQPRDRSQTSSDRPMTRQACGLPERGFVFCCFNQNYKITPEIFDIWARLLRTVDGSVLWLLEGNAAAPANLRCEAERRGVPGDRLVFATHIPPGEHLARHRQADLFLDTRPYNAHTTASDALWAGLPVVTCPGETFASRVTASLLEAAMLPELVTRSLDEYASLALALARDPDQLAAIKAKLATNRLIAPLFDTARYTRNLEAAFTEMWSRRQRGDAPASFAVDAIR
jgi:predicted O-linked N-acetylglucosamine transferase (SPINDLY family)